MTDQELYNQLRRDKAQQRLEKASLEALKSLAKFRAEVWPEYLQDWVYWLGFRYSSKN